MFSGKVIRCKRLHVGSSRQFTNSTNMTQIQTQSTTTLQTQLQQEIYELSASTGPMKETTTHALFCFFLHTALEAKCWRESRAAAQTGWHSVMLKSQIR